MTYKDIAEHPVKCRWNNGSRAVDAVVVLGKDNKMYILHNDPEYNGDHAGDIRAALGYRYSWSFGGIYSENQHREINLGSYNLSEISVTTRTTSLQFKTQKRITL